MNIELVRLLLQRRQETKALLEDAVGLFREYVEVHGHDPDSAARRAVVETLVGMDSAVYLHDNPMEAPF